MTPEQEQKVLSAIYDRLFQAITYEPESGGTNPFKKKETLIQFTNNEALNPSSFDDAWTPGNVNADLGASEMFARMVDKVSGMGLAWQPKDQPLSQTYKSIVQGANEAEDARPSEKAIAAYEKAQGYLEATEKNPFTDEETPCESPAYKAYKKNLTALSKAYEDYVFEYNKFVDKVAKAEKDGDDDAKKEAQRAWNGNARPLQRTIESAQENLTADNGKWVQMALDTMDTSINDATARVLKSAQAMVQTGQIGTAGVEWFLTYANPTNWNDKSAADNFSELTISGGNATSNTSTTTHGYSFKGSYGLGLWKVGAESSGEFKQFHSDASSDSLSITANVGKIDIVRPWFNELLFRSSNWYTNLRGDDDVEYISDGTISDTNVDKILPMYPVAFIVARDIRIKADFSQEEMDTISRKIEAGASVSYGPFTVGGKYSHGHEEEHMKSSFENGELKVPGMQIIGWVNRVIPACPTRPKSAMDKPGAAGVEEAEAAE